MKRRVRDLGRRLLRTIALSLLVSAGIGAGIGVSAQAEPAAIALPGNAAYPESITATADGTLYVSSFASGGVTRVKPGSKEGEIWIKPGAFDTRSTFGVLADEASNTLWVCSNDLSALGVKGPSEVKGSALKGFDLKTGEGKLSAALPEGPSICNDIALGPDGAAYVTNTLRPEIYRLAPGSRTLEVWKTDPLFAVEGKEAGLDGIAFGKDGNLYLNTFTQSKLFRVVVKDGKAGAVTPLTPSRPLTFSDALRPIGDGTFLMAEGGGRLDRLTVEGDTARIEVLKDGVPGGVTGVAKVGNTAWITEGQLAVLTDPSKKGIEPQRPFHVYAVPLTQP